MACAILETNKIIIWFELFKNIDNVIRRLSFFSDWWINAGVWGSNFHLCWNIWLIVNFSPNLIWTNDGLVNSLDLHILKNIWIRACLLVVVVVVVYTVFFFCFAFVFMSPHRPKGIFYGGHHYVPLVVRYWLNIYLSNKKWYYKFLVENKVYNGIRSKIRNSTFQCTRVFNTWISYF